MLNESPLEKLSLDKLPLDRLPSLISLLGVVILCASVIHDYWFFRILGTSFSEMPTTLSDHFRSSLNWISVVIIIVFLFSTVEVFIIWVENIISEKISQPTSSRLKRMIWYMSIIYLFVFVLIAAIPLIKLSFNLDISIGEWTFYVFAFWILFFRYIFEYEKIKQLISNESRVAILVILSVVIFSGYLGASNAQEITKGGGTQYVFDLGETKIVGTLARSFEKNYLIWDKDEKRIKLVNVNEVIQLYPQPETDNSDQKNPTISK